MNEMQHCRMRYDNAVIVSMVMGGIESTMMGIGECPDVCLCVIFRLVSGAALLYLGRSIEVEASAAISPRRIILSSNELAGWHYFVAVDPLPVLR